jgi:hypothetical protein
MLGLRGRMKRHITVILGVAALSLGVFVAPASADGPPDDTVLQATLVFASTSGGTITVHCSVDDESDNWEHIDAAECADLGNIDGRSLELDLDVTDFGNGLCEGTFQDILWVNNPDWEMDDPWESALIYAKIKVTDIYSEDHDPAVFQTRTDCTGYGIPGGDDFDVEACKDFSDDSLLAVPFALTTSSNINDNVSLLSPESHAVEGVQCVEWAVWTDEVPYHAYGVIYSYDDADDPHLLVAIQVIPSIYNVFGEDLATNLLGLDVAPPVPGGSVSVTETVPAGYTGNASACANIAVSVFGGSEECTIVNTLIPAAPAAPAGGAAAAAGGASSGLPSFTG